MPIEKKKPRWLLVKVGWNEMNGNLDVHLLPGTAAHGAWLRHVLFVADHGRRNVSALKINHLLAWGVGAIGNALSSATAVCDCCECSFTVERQGRRSVVNGAVGGTVYLRWLAMLTPRCR